MDEDSSRPLKEEGILRSVHGPTTDKLVELLTFSTARAAMVENGVCVEVEDSRLACERDLASA